MLHSLSLIGVHILDMVHLDYHRSYRSMALGNSTKKKVLLVENLLFSCPDRLRKDALKDECADLVFDTLVIPHDGVA